VIRVCVIRVCVIRVCVNRVCVIVVSLRFTCRAVGHAHGNTGALGRHATAFLREQIGTI